MSVTTSDSGGTTVIAETTRWLERAVIGLNLCPFAKAVHVKSQVRMALSDATNIDALCEDLLDELQMLAHADPDQIETTLLIHPHVLGDFLDYNDFLEIADRAVEELKLGGQLQVASFHPHYQFADTATDDITNYTNRSPHPTLHLLRESSIDRAVAAYPEAATIFEKNMATMKQLGHPGWRALFAA